MQGVQSSYFSPATQEKIETVISYIPILNTITLIWKASSLNNQIHELKSEGSNADKIRILNEATAMQRKFNDLKKKFVDNRFGDLLGSSVGATVAFATPFFALGLGLVAVNFVSSMLKITALYYFNKTSNEYVQKNLVPPHQTAGDFLSPISLWVKSSNTHSS